MSKPKLDPNTILSREFEYAAQTAIQANEDRVRVFNYYLATVGTMIAAAVLADQTSDMRLVIFGLAISGLAFLGVVSLLKLAKLRIAWAESARAMCQIKEYYSQMCDEIQLGRAFRWKMKTIPAVGKKWTIAFLMALVIMFLSSISAGGAVFFWCLIVTGEKWIFVSAIVGSASFAGQIVVWHHLCRD